MEGIVWLDDWAAATSPSANITDLRAGRQCLSLYLSPRYLSLLRGGSNCKLTQNMPGSGIWSCCQFRCAIKGIEVEFVSSLIQSAREQLFVIQKYSPECSPESPAQIAFDPYIGRHLQWSLRLIYKRHHGTQLGGFWTGWMRSACWGRRTSSLPGKWVFTVCVCSGWAHFSSIDSGSFTTMVTQFSCTSAILAIFDSTNLRNWSFLLKKPKSTFHDGFLISHRHPSDWMVNQFFCETIGVDYDSINEAILERWTESHSGFKQLDQVLHKV